ncbi:hypothetical protein LNTAR_18403 [Lentisphaera araneosa HTCC2155]|uniref:Uncharacterized protein n=1 Tax=Lentisphaera araneosa HTCC2155 TaxID=313628 RepID=A6DG19_9BACT|nr:hypothetical protein [Lentisphaera araneosa]EDM29749.1 hypothetical protein LNTAR_18403 [Lentisphaera araneosa HTCC2155]
MIIYRLKFDFNNCEWLYNVQSDRDEYIFNGDSLSESWKTLNLYTDRPNSIKDLSKYGVGVIVFSSKVLENDKLLTCLELGGELLPVEIEEVGKAYIYNITSVCNAIDSQKTIYRYALSDKPFAIGFEKPTFIKNRLSNSSIFKVPLTSKTEIYVQLDGLEDSSFNFKKIIEESGIKGLNFTEVYKE